MLFRSLWKKFEELTSIKASNGRTVRIWKDKWIEPKAMEEYPHLFSFARDQDIYLEKFHAQSEENIYELFHCPLSLIAAEECDSQFKTCSNGQIIMKIRKTRTNGSSSGLANILVKRFMNNSMIRKLHLLLSNGSGSLGFCPNKDSFSGFFYWTD